MKKGLLLAGIVLWTGLQSFAQGVGIEAGINLNSMRATMHGSKVVSPPRAGLRAGVVMDEPLSEKLSVQTGAFYSAKGGNIKYSSSFDDNGTPVMQTTDGYIRVDYVEIPLSLLYNMPAAGGRFFAGGGPYVAVAFGGLVGFEREYRLNGSTRKMRVLMPGSVGGDPETADFNHFDAGLNLQFGYEIAKSFYTRAQFAYGLADINPAPNNTIRNTALALTIGYMIR